MSVHRHVQWLHACRTSVYLSVQFNLSVASNSAPHGLQHARPPCPLPTPRACSNPCPWSWWCRPTSSSSVVPFSSSLQSFPASGFSSSESGLRIRRPKYWSFSFSISPSNKYSGLISFRIDWFYLFTVQETLKSLLNSTVWKLIYNWWPELITLSITYIKWINICNCLFFLCNSFLCII